VASRGFLESIEWIDGDRIGVMGSSFGGYLTLAAMTFHPEVFDAAISIVGYSDVIDNITSGGWRLPRLAAAYDEMGHPEGDAERLRRVSPLFYAHRISRPLFVAAGANDVRVPIHQNDRLVAAAREAGVHVEYLVFQDEGHGFRRRENRIAAVEAYLEFLDRFLRGDDGAG
jgi:dipeptidyl aminopeptidase/acylaminoacyl peptidase